MKYKKFIAIFCIALIVVFQIPIIKSNAETIVVPSDENGKFYLYNHVDFSTWTYDDFLTVNNYDLYFNTLSGDEKTKFNNIFVDDIHNTQSYFKKIIYGLMNPNLSGANNIWLGGFKIDDNYIPFEDCKISCAHVNLDSDAITFTLTYSPSNTPVIVSGNTLYSEQPFYMRYSGCNFGGGGSLPDGNDYYSFSNFSTMMNESFMSHWDNSHQVYYWSYQGYPFNGYFYAEDIVLFTGYTNNYPNIDDTIEAYEGYKNNNSLCVDRRTFKFIDKSTGHVTVLPSDYGFKQGSFKNAIYGSTFDNQNIFVAYELNDLSNSIKDDLYLRLDYVFNLDGVFNNYDLDYSGQYSTINGLYDLYSLSDSNYVNVDLDDIFRSMSLNDSTINTQYENIDRFYDPSKYSNVVSPVRQRGVDPLDCFNILYNNGLITSAPVSISYNDEFLESLTVNYKDFGFNVKINTNSIYNSASTSVPSINRLDSCNLTVIESIYNVKTGESSQACMFSYDYLTKSMQEVGSLEKEGEIFSGDYSNGSQSSLSNPNSSNMNYDIATGQYYPSNAYGGSSSAYNGGNTVIVNPTQIPYLLVDVPEGEWMNKTPNLTGILTDFKNALEEVHDESILPIMTETYNYLPAPMWQYLTYAVELLLMIGIWRGITRR